ncbi:MAG: hypothetical protein Q9202_002101 [Teloschistes flavicans]
MAIQTISSRYISKKKLMDLLVRLFGPDQCTVEFNDNGAEATATLHLPRKLEKKDLDEIRNEEAGDQTITEVRTDNSAAHPKF